MFSKKGVSELVSFVFITLIVVIASTSAYVVSKHYIEDSLSEIDRASMEKNLKKLDREIDELVAYDNATSSIPISFNTGELSFNTTNVSFQTFESYNASETYCLNSLCYQNIGGFERMSIGLPSNYQFSENLSLSPGTYLIILSHSKAENKIYVRYR